jgi:hypothetical protein
VNGFLTYKEMLCITINEKGYLFAGTNGNTTSNYGIFRSLDYGLSWENISDGLTDQKVKAVLITSDSVLFAGTNGGGIFRSFDKGTTWQQVNNGLVNIPLNVYSLTENKPGHIYVGMYGAGVYESTDNGDSWHELATGLNNKFANAVVVSKNGYLFCGSYYGGVYRSAEKVRTQNTVTADPTGTLSLEQNYPSPFRGMTTIRYRLEKPTNVLLSVYDVLGREITTLVNEMKESGSYEVPFDGSSLTPGTYVIRLGAEGRSVQVQTMIVK